MGCGPGPCSGIPQEVFTTEVCIALCAFAIDVRYVREVLLLGFVCVFCVTFCRFTVVIVG